MDKRETYSIKEAATFSGLSIKQVRRYSDADLLPGVIKIQHGDRIYRHFTELDLNMLRLIRKYRDQGYYLAPAVKLAKQELAGK